MTDSNTPKRKTLGIKATTASTSGTAKKPGGTRPVRVSDLNRKRVQAVAEGIKRAHEKAGSKPSGPKTGAAGHGGARPKPAGKFGDSEQRPRRFERDSAQDRPRRYGDDESRPPRRFNDGENRPPRRFGDNEARPPRRFAEGESRPPRRYGDDESRPRRFTDGENRPPRRFGDNEARPPRRFAEGENRPPRPYGDNESRPRRFNDGENRPPRRYGDNEARPPRQFTEGESRPPRRYGDDESRPRRFADGENRPPRRYGDNEARPPRRFAEGENRPPRRYGDNESRPPRFAEGENRPPRRYGDNEARPPRRFAEGENRPPRRYGDNESRPPRSTEGENRPPRRYGDNESRPPRRFAEGENRPPHRYGDNESRPPRRFADGENRPPRPYGDNESRPRRFADGDNRPPYRAGADESRPRRFTQDESRPRREGTAPARRFSDTGDRARPPRAEAPVRSAPRDDSHAEQDGLVRLSKRMSELGLCSRREADEWIPRGWVLVDGKPVTELGSRVRPDAEIEIAQAARSEQGERVTVLLHKPVGYVSGQAEDGYEPAAVLFTEENHWDGDPTRKRFAPWQHKSLAPAGRLDIDSTGLLVLTQDGRIARTLIGDDSTVEKEYLVRVSWESPEGLVEDDISHVFPEDKLDLLRHGLSLDGVELKPAKVSWQNEEQLRFVLREGRKRQIRRMCEQVGLRVTGLKRVRMGRIVLGDLPPGKWRFLGQFEKF